MERCAASNTSDAEREDDEDDLADDEDDLADAKDALGDIEGALTDLSTASASLDLAPIAACLTVGLCTALALDAAPLSEAMPLAAALPTASPLPAPCRNTFFASFATVATDIFFVAPRSSIFNRFCCSGVYLQNKNHDLKTMSDAKQNFAKRDIAQIVTNVQEGGGHAHCSAPTSHALRSRGAFNKPPGPTRA